MIIEKVEAHLASLSLQPTLLEQINSGQKEDLEGRRIVEAIENGQRKDLRLNEEGNIKFSDRLWVP